MKMLRNCSCVLLAAILGCQQSQSTATNEAKSTPIASAQAPAAQPKYACFGAPAKLSDADAIPVQQMLAKPDDYAGKYVRLTGTVDKVCPNKGCWMTLKGADDGEALFVKFPDPEQGRLIPLDAAGKQAIVEGTVRVKEIPAETAKHYAEESGATPQQLAKITGPQKQITVASPCAMVAGVKNEQEAGK
jgi:hypothetical protein